MTHPRPGNCGPLIPGLAVFILVSLLVPTFGEEIKAVGQVESLYRGRVSLHVLAILSPASGTTSMKVGDHVSFSLPKVSTRREKRPIAFGNVIEVDLEGNVATEYDQAASGTEAVAAADKPTVLIWTARRAERVKSPRQYLEPEEDGGKGKGKGRRHRKHKDKEAPQIWTQEEVVTAKVLVRSKRLYLKEDRLRPRDKGLDVVDDEWYEKLKEHDGQRVVVYGSTHRTSISSGTIEIKSIMKVYPK